MGRPFFIAGSPDGGGRPPGSPPAPAAQRNDRRALRDLADEIGISAPTCLRRMRRLESAGVIRGHAALLENGLVGLRVTACVEVSLVDPSGANMRTFERRMQACPQLIQCSELSGDVDYLLTVVAEDLSGFASCTRKFLADNDRIRAYRSMLVLRQTKNEHVLPIG